LYVGRACTPIIRGIGFSTSTHSRVLEWASTTQSVVGQPHSSQKTTHPSHLQRARHPQAHPCHGGYTGDHPHGRAVNLMRVESKDSVCSCAWSRRAELLRCRHFTHPDMTQTPRPQSTHTPTSDSSETPHVRCTSRRAAPPRPDMASSWNGTLQSIGQFFRSLSTGEIVSIR
jgi:hypothetical protein